MIREIDKKIGKLMRQERKLRGITQDSMGTSIGVTFQQIQKYESGINRVTISTLIPILNLFGMSPTEFFNKLLGETPEKVACNVSQMREFASIPAAFRSRILDLARAVKENKLN